MAELNRFWVWTRRPQELCFIWGQDPQLERGTLGGHVPDTLWTMDACRLRARQTQSIARCRAVTTWRCEMSLPLHSSLFTLPTSVCCRRMSFCLTRGKTREPFDTAFQFSMGGDSGMAGAPACHPSLPRTVHQLPASWSVKILGSLGLFFSRDKCTQCRRLIIVVFYANTSERAYEMFCNKVGYNTQALFFLDHHNRSLTSVLPNTILSQIMWCLYKPVFVPLLPHCCH